MASSSVPSWLALALLLLVALAATANGDELSPGYYEKTCPNVHRVVRSVMASSVAAQPRMAPAVLRLFFHDCFINGCDASVLLDATPFSRSEKNMEPSASLTGYAVIDDINSARSSTTARPPSPAPTSSPTHPATPSPCSEDPPGACPSAARTRASPPTRNPPRTASPARTTTSASSSPCFQGSTWTPVT
uniref:Plant heme peroxidase family profile domain-containing protein n=1 Tax=Triticum urartu TaxID=4572 RepID=A0A8R7V823_TRIUA